ncbi:subtilisin-like serine protease [Serendipita sp. 399]|nr:subtilisin-like serine protease [Serendipita sp. 399]
MATPHVAGLAAYLLSKDKSMAPAAVSDKIKSLGTANVIGGAPPGTVNLLAYNGGGSISGAVPVPPTTTTTSESASAPPAATSTAVEDPNTPVEGKNVCPSWWPDCFWKDWF